MRYLSVCAGIEAATVAWHHLGWEAAAFSEIEAFPRAVLAHHHPDVPLHGDFTTIKGYEYGPIDLLVGGTPCQSFSIAGLRGGLDDDRGNLALEFLRLAQRTRPKWLVWENVPGVLSSNGGRDFGSIIGGMVECGYGIAYRVLDAQYFGVPQRRRRVFVVGCLGDAASAAAVLFERQSLCGDSPPRREKREDVAGVLTSRASGGGGGPGAGTDEAAAGYLQPVTYDRYFDRDGELVTDASDFEVCGTLSDGAHMGGGLNGQDAYTGRVLPVQAYSIMPMNSGKDYKARETDVAQPLMAGGPVGGNQGGDYVCAFAHQQGGSIGLHTSKDCALALQRSQTQAVAFDTYNQTTSDVSQPIRSAASDVDKMGAVLAHSAVRRLTPRECERLQGFPDDYTLIPYRNKPAENCPDGPRYKALGNSMAVPVMRWIGERINMINNL